WDFVLGHIGEGALHLPHVVGVRVERFSLAPLAPGQARRRGDLPHAWGSGREGRPSLFYIIEAAPIPPERRRFIWRSH
ncbi:MAG TPA: hypothetical protein VLL28_13195, partial [Hyphomicrobiaceae bacterium]|nr:hypothetical protein [Hyphomicrobiaceae bacterium]